MPSVSNTIVVDSTTFTEVNEYPTRTIFTDISSATTVPFEIEVQQNTSGKRGAARNSVIVVRKDIPYTTATGATQVERVSASITIRHQPDVLYADKSTQLAAILSTLTKLISDSDISAGLIAGVHNFHNVTISSANS